MARKIGTANEAAELPEGRAAPAPEAPASTGADDLPILEPERTLTIGGRAITVREYGFVEGFEVKRKAKPLLDALLAAADGDGEFRTDTILDVLEEHPDTLTELIAQACDVDADWLRDRTQVSDAAGQNLLTTWWLVNSDFFMRRVVRRLAIRNALEQASAAEPASDGLTSTPASSSMDTISVPSAATRSVN